MGSIIIGLFMMPFLIHSLGDEQYGLWVLVGAVVSFYSLMDFGMATAIQRFLIRSIHADDEEESKTALTTSFVLSSAIGAATLLITIGIIVFSPLYLSENVDVLLFNITIGLVGLKASLQLPLFSYYGILVAKYRYDIISVVQIVTLVIRSALIVLFITYGYGIIAVAAIMLVSDIAGSLVVVQYAKRFMPELKISLSYFRTSELKEYFNFGKWNYVIQVTQKIRFSIDELVVGTIIGINAVTHYAIASTLITYFSSFMESAFGVFEPIFHKYHKLNQWDNLRETFLITTEITTYASILVGCLIFTLGEPFINVWMGEEYLDAFTVLLILCSANIFYKAILPCEKIVFAIAKQKFYAKVSTLDAITNLGLSITLATHMGIYGVALGTIIPSMISNLILLPMYTCKQLTIPYRQFYLILLKGIFLGGIIFIPAYYVILIYGPQNLFTLALTGTLVTIVYTPVCFRFFISKKAAALMIDSLPDRFVPYIKMLTKA
jgi:O-antigen/teichoic acid export membrane protein